MTLICQVLDLGLRSQFHNINNIGVAGRGVYRVIIYGQRRFDIQLAGALKNAAKAVGK
jgi:hypothetical protein